MKTVNVYEAKAHLSCVIDEARSGKELVLTNNAEPLVRLVPVREGKPSDASAWTAALSRLPTTSTSRSTMRRS
ncbi:MAG: type II toxin-antitoxin system Phd/YefM family antitoxin [Candidatus Baltobacteraceae bacterium]